MDQKVDNTRAALALLKQNIPGFRDLGGLPVELPDCRSGSITPGLLFRSGRLPALHGYGQRLFEQLSIGCILDLRSLDERAEHPDPQFAGVSYPAAADANRTVENPLSLEQVITLFRAAEKGEADTHEYMLKVYSTFPETLAGALVFSIAYLADPGSKALLIHCTGGKDRTGFAAAVIQKLLGVPEATIYSDYCSSGFHGRALEEHGVIYAKKFTKWGVCIPPELTYPLLSPQRDYLSAAFTAIETQYGGWDAYVQNYLQIPETTIELLRQRLLQINY